MVNVANIDLTYELLGRFPASKSVHAVCTLSLHSRVTQTYVYVELESMVGECLGSTPGPAVFKIVLAQAYACISQGLHTLLMIVTAWLAAAALTLSPRLR